MRSTINRRYCQASLVSCTQRHGSFPIRSCATKRAMFLETAWTRHGAGIRRTPSTQNIHLHARADHFCHNFINSNTRTYNLRNNALGHISMSHRLQRESWKERHFSQEKVNRVGFVNDITQAYELAASDISKRRHKLPQD